MDGYIKVLLVKDDLVQAERVGNSLKTYDSRFQVDIIPSAKVSIRNLRKNNYEAIIVDHPLDHEIGYDVFNKISGKGLDIPIVWLSHGSEGSAAQKLIQCGNNDCLIKDEDYLSVLPQVIQKGIEQNRLESKLADPGHSYQNIFELANDAILILDQFNHRILEANLHTTKLTGFSKDELSGREFVNLFPTEQREMAENMVQRTISDGSYRDDSLSLFTRDENRIPVDINANVIFLGDGRYILCIVRNISEKKHLQTLIINSKKRLQSIFDGITDIVYQVNQDFEIIMANKKVAELCKTKPEHLIGVKCYDAAFICQEPCVDCPIQITFDTQKPIFLEKAHGEQILEIWSYPIFTPEGSMDSAVVYCKDVTEKKKLEKSLVQSEKLATIGLLSSGIAHEIRNPLNIIETARYYISEFLPDAPEDIRDKLEMIRKNIRRASKIINNLLEFSRPSEQKREHINLKKLIDSTFTLIGKELKANNIETYIHCDDNYRAYFNFESLKQILLNIIINAVQAMPEGGALTVQIEPNNEKWIDVRIADTGVGIPDENLPHIFSPFFTTKEVGVGTGLGLYVSHMILRREGGRIHLKSKVGEGTTFTLSLPCSE